ncbi:hypothetical protein BDB01DRAFT_788671, partial [Pilobolus umbonatus]
MDDRQNESSMSIEQDFSHLTSLLDSLRTLSIENRQTKDKVDTINSLLNLSQNELEFIIKAVKLSSWSDDTMADLCIEIEKSNIPNITAIMIIQSTVYSKTCQSTGNLSRVLLNTIMLLGRSKGKVILDGLIIPLLFHTKLVRPVLDILTKSIGCLSPNLRTTLLQVILSDGKLYRNNDDNFTVIEDDVHSLYPWDDSIFQIIGSILSTQPYLLLTRETMLNMIDTVKNIVQSNPKDKGSMQLLLVLTTKYPHTIVEHDVIDHIDEITQHSQMFLKRAI